MIYLKSITEPLSDINKRRPDLRSINLICKRYGIQNYTINDDASIDVDGSVWIVNKKLYELPLKLNRIGGDFYCGRNFLSSLINFPKYVGGDFNFKDNYIESLKGCPEYVGYDFICYDNQLTSLEGFPEDYEGPVYIGDNPVYEIVKIFPEKIHSKAIYWINEFDVIRDGRKVVMDRFEEVFVQMDLDIPSKIKFKNYETI